MLDSNTTSGFLSRWPPLLIALNAALAAVTGTFVRKELIPENMQTIGWIAPFFVILGFLVAAPRRQSLRRHFLTLFCVALLLSSALALMHLYWVKGVEDLGRPGETHSFLVGFDYSKHGEAWVNEFGTRSTEEYIVLIGPDRIPVMWGDSFTLAATAYAAAYLFLLLSFVLLLAVTDLAPASADAQGKQDLPPPTPS